MSAILPVRGFSKVFPYISDFAGYVFKRTVTRVSNTYTLAQNKLSPPLCRSCARAERSVSILGKAFDTLYFKVDKKLETTIEAAQRLFERASDATGVGLPSSKILLALVTVPPLLVTAWLGGGDAVKHFSLFHAMTAAPSLLCVLVGCGLDMSMGCDRLLREGRAPDIPTLTRRGIADKKHVRMRMVLSTTRCLMGTMAAYTAFMIVVGALGPNPGKAIAGTITGMAAGITGSNAIEQKFLVHMDESRERKKKEFMKLFA